MTSNLEIFLCGWFSASAPCVNHRHGNYGVHCKDHQIGGKPGRLAGKQAPAFQAGEEETLGEAADQGVVDVNGQGQLAAVPEDFVIQQSVQPGAFVEASQNQHCAGDKVDVGVFRKGEDANRCQKPGQIPEDPVLLHRFIVRRGGEEIHQSTKGKTAEGSQQRHIEDSERMALFGLMSK